MTATAIEWTDEVWNPVLGCDRVSPGCDNCYAIRTATIRAGNPNPKIRDAFAGLTERRNDRLDWTGRINLLPERLDAPLHWRKPRRVFVNSQADLFHADVPDGFIAAVFEVMARAEQHTFQVLTKRHGRMRSLLQRWASGDRPSTTFDRHGRNLGEVVHTDPWIPPRNVWLGVSVEDQQRADLRIPALLDTPAAVRWLSCEPLLGPVDLARYLWSEPSGLTGDWRRGVGWVVAGGESGPGARPAHPGWFGQLRDQCETSGVPYFHKQHGDWTWVMPPGEYREPQAYVALADGRVADEATALAAGGDWSGVWRVGKKAAGRELDKQVHDAMPERAR